MMTKNYEALRKAASNAINYMVYDVVACNGLKCREQNCESCFDEDSVRDYVNSSREAIKALAAALKDMEDADDPRDKCNWN